MERETLEFDVVFVGGGPANLSGAFHLAQLVKTHNVAVQSGAVKGAPLGDIEIAVIEKGASVGAHILSGAVMDPRGLKELMPDFIEQGAPLESPVKEDHFLYLTKTRAIRSPVTPPPLVNHGYFIVSLNRLTAWLGEKCEEAGVNVFPEFPGADMLYDEADRVIGVRTGDKGVDKEGKHKANYEPGVDLHAKVTVLGEGPRGSLAKQLIQRLNLDDGREPQVYSIGVKELWELPDDRYPAGRVTHTLGFPSDSKTYGGGWVYGMQNRILNIGYVTGLDYHDPLLDPHAEFQRFKQHPFLAKLLGRRQDDSLRRQGDRCGRLLCDAQALRRRRPAGGGLRRLLKLAALERNSFGDQERYAGGRDDLRSAPGRRFFSTAVKAVRGSRQCELDHAGVAQGAKLSRGVSTRSLARHR